jgi:hypothetical protein
MLTKQKIWLAVFVLTLCVFLIPLVCNWYRGHLIYFYGRPVSVFLSPPPPTFSTNDEAKLMQQNPDWHVISEIFSNAPYWLMPTNVPYHLYPLNNSKWVWTTNMNATLFGSDTYLGLDNVKLRQVELQQQQHMDKTDPPGIANVMEYHGRRWDQKHVWNTNMLENWWGVWVEDTNTGWRVNLCPFNPSGTNEGVIVKVGSVVTNSGAGLLPSPDGKYVKLELLDSNGKAVPTRSGAALNLYRMLYAVQKESQIINAHTPSNWDATVERNYPDTISDLEYPRSNVDFPLSKKGGFFRFVGFVSNGPPCQIGFIKFNDIFDIKTEGDYTLTVQPVLYRMHYDGGTFQGYLDRVDLPCVTTKVHLVPNASSGN